MASNQSTLGSRLRASDIRVGGRYSTRTASGLVIARVVKALPLDKKQRNQTFECIDVNTGEYLPRPKRAADLDPICT